MATPHPAPRTPVMVETVHGPIPADQLGMTLTHEHLFAQWVARAAVGETESRPVDATMQWLLTENPAYTMDNLVHNDVPGIAEELGWFTAQGGRTIIDCTLPEIGRSVSALQEIATHAGINIVMGSGWYLERFDEDRSDTSIDELVEQLTLELTEGVDGTGIKPGIIGEIGVSPLFTDSERLRLRAAARVQKRVGVPLVIHMPGWQRRAPEVLQIVLDEEGVAPGAVVLCHMDPSGEDATYQRAVGERGVWMEFDMIGKNTWFEGEGQSPSPEQTANAVARLIAQGFAGQILLSHDLGAKSDWTRYGANGLGFIHASSCLASYAMERR